MNQKKLILLFSLGLLLLNPIIVNASNNLNLNQCQILLKKVLNPTNWLSLINSNYRIKEAKKTLRI